MKLTKTINKALPVHPKKLFLAGLVFPLVVILIMIFADSWLENYRLLRVVNCYLPMPFFFLLQLICFFFLSLAFFFPSCSFRCEKGENVYNMRIMLLCSAFLLVIWFCLEFCAMSPFAALFCALASFAFGFCGMLCAGRVGYLPFLFSLFALIWQGAVFVMNLKVLFV